MNLRICLVDQAERTWLHDLCLKLTFCLNFVAKIHILKKLAEELLFQVRQNVPRVSYVSLLDIWMLVCMIFVFSCILEFIVITVHIRSGKKALGERVNIYKMLVEKEILLSGKMQI